MTIRGRAGANTVLLPAKVKRKALKAGRPAPEHPSRRPEAARSAIVARNVKVKAVPRSRR